MNRENKQGESMCVKRNRDRDTEKKRESSVARMKGKKMEGRGVEGRKRI